MNRERPKGVEDEGVEDKNKNENENERKTLEAKAKVLENVVKEKFGSKKGKLSSQEQGLKNILEKTAKIAGRKPEKKED